jgi:hypothetical protein
MALVKTTDIKDTILLQVPNANIAFRMLKKDFERQETITCPVNSMSYSKKELKVIEGR